MFNVEPFGVNMSGTRHKIITARETQPFCTNFQVSDPVGSLVPAHLPSHVPCTFFVTLKVNLSREKNDHTVECIILETPERRHSYRR